MDVKEKKRQRERYYYENNPEVQEYRRQYNKMWRLNNPERYKERKRLYHLRPEVKERQRQQNREYMRRRRQRPEYQQYMKEYRQEYLQRPEVKQHRREYYLEYNRRRAIGTIINGKKVRIFIDKRERPEVCEICEKVAKRLSYHHWDGNFSFGMWLCLACHQLAEGVEKGKLEKYLSLKKLIEQDYEKRLCNSRQN